MKNTILLTLIVLALACNKRNKGKVIDITPEINSLSSYSEKNEYLEMIYDLDQNIRINNEAALTLGTKAHDKHGKTRDSIDDLNYKRIDFFLQKYGYPHIDSVSKKASSIPWLIIHHSNLNDRLKHFRILREAYKDGSIDIMQYDFYLGRTYQMKFGKYPKWDGPYKPEDKVNWLIKELDID